MYASYDRFDHSIGQIQIGIVSFTRKHDLSIVRTSSTIDHFYNFFCVVATKASADAEVLQSLVMSFQGIYYNYVVVV